MDKNPVYARFYGDSSFPVEWASEDEKQHFWWYDDLHIPRPVSPLYFDIGGWWGPTCAYMFRRFGVPFGKEWLAKRINGYVYTAVVRRDPEEAERLAPYFNMMLPVYARGFLRWWRERYLPEIQRNLDYLDNYPYHEASLEEMLVLLEDALDIQERHFRIHWILNLAQFAAFSQFNNLVRELLGPEAAELTGKILVSVDDKNWEATRELWKIKEEIKRDPQLLAIFEESPSVPQLVAALQQVPAGQRVLQSVDRYKKEYGYKAVYSHEYVYRLWVEDPTPIFELLRGYVASDYDFEQDNRRVREERDAAIAALRDRITDPEARSRFEEALELALAMAPLTPDHHFYIDQGTYARMRIVLKELGEKFVARGDFDDPEDIFYLLYDEIRQLAAVPSAFDARGRIAERKAERERAFGITPRDWVGTADHWSLYEQAYVTLWGYPERFRLSQEQDAQPRDVIRGLAASPGVVEGVARYVDSPEDFDKVQPGDILVCRMTNPAWTLIFTKISGLVTDSGGILSHPAVVAREFGIPAVTSTLNASQRIRSGQRVRVDGTQGVVTILG